MVCQGVSCGLLCGLSPLVLCVITCAVWLAKCFITCYTQVGVDVSLPYGMELELVLRKRVCVRVYKKKSLRDSMRGFMQDIPKR